MYQYGDPIRWDRKRIELANIRADPILEGMYRMNFMDAMFTFAHVYLGFAKVIEAMSGLKCHDGIPPT